MKKQVPLCGVAVSVDVSVETGVLETGTSVGGGGVAAGDGVATGRAMAGVGNGKAGIAATVVRFVHVVA